MVPRMLLFEDVIPMHDNHITNKEKAVCPRRINDSDGIGGPGF